MNRQDRERQERTGEKRTEPQHERESGKPDLAPPVEREHETQAGAIEEEEKRKHERS